MAPEHEHLWRLDGRCEYAGCDARNTEVPEQHTLDRYDDDAGDLFEEGRRLASRREDLIAHTLVGTWHEADHEGESS